MTSLRAKLIASHVFVILLALLLLLLIAGAYLHRYEADRERERMQEIAAPLSVAAVTIERASRTPGAMIDRLDELDALADRMGVRVLLFSADGAVEYDTAETGNLQGESWPGYVTDFLDFVERNGDRGLRANQRLIEVADDGPLKGSTLLLSSPGRQANDSIIAIASEGVDQPWFALLTRRLMLVAIISLVGASIAGYFLSNHLSKPIVDLTAASDAMASGDLVQQVPGEGPDELGRLVASFNAMSQRVADTDIQQRQLLADVAHELRTPLTSIQGYALAIENGIIANEADRSRAIDVIRGESTRMASLIEQLLDLARLESGQISIRHEPVDAHDLLDTVITRYAAETERAGIKVSHTAEAGVVLTGDRQRLDQMLSNLLSNAIRHTPPGGEISVTAQRAPGGGGKTDIILRVSDSGQGIPAEALPGIFERFSKGSGGGTGLGLAIVKQIVELHHGRISVSSQPGQGTVFEVHLPGSDAVPRS